MCSCSIARCDSESLCGNVRRRCRRKRLLRPPLLLYLMVVLLLLSILEGRRRGLEEAGAVVVLRQGSETHVGKEKKVNAQDGEMFVVQSLSRMQTQKVAGSGAKCESTKAPKSLKKNRSEE